MRGLLGPSPQTPGGDLGGGGLGTVTGDMAILVAAKALSDLRVSRPKCLSQCSLVVDLGQPLGGETQRRAYLAVRFRIKLRLSRKGDKRLGVSYCGKSDGGAGRPLSPALGICGPSRNERSSLDAKKEKASASWVIAPHQVQKV